MVNAFDKHPSETYPIAVDYATAAPTGAVLQSGTWSAVDDTTGADATATVLDSTVAVITGTEAKVRVENGEEGHSYKLQVEVVFDTGDILVDNVFMHINDNG